MAGTGSKTACPTIYNLSGKKSVDSVRHRHFHHRRPTQAGQPGTPTPRRATCRRSAGPAGAEGIGLTELYLQQTHAEQRKQNRKGGVNDPRSNLSQRPPAGGIERVTDVKAESALTRDTVLLERLRDVNIPDLDRVHRNTPGIGLLIENAASGGTGAPGPHHSWHRGNRDIREICGSLRGLHQQSDRPAPPRDQHLLYEAIKEKGSMVIVPSSAVETMGLGGMLGTSALASQKH